MADEIKYGGKSYLMKVVGILVILATVIGGLIYSLVGGDPDINDIILETSNGTPALNPTGSTGPTEPPNLTPPTTPPPGISSPFGSG